MQAVVMTLAFATTATPPREEKTVVATGGSSEPVGGLRGRLVVARGRTLGDGPVRESVVYVELETVSDAYSGARAVYFDPGAFRCDLLDAAGKAVPPAGMVGGGRPGAVWVTLPDDSAIRLRATPFGFGSADGVRITLNGADWHIRAGDPNAYSLAGTLTVSPPGGQDRATSWKGVLTFPAVKLAAPAEIKP